MKIGRLLILSFLLVGYGGTAGADNIQRTLPDDVEGVKREVISLNGEW